MNYYYRTNICSFILIPEAGKSFINMK